MAARPLRRRNFVSIEIGRHLVRQGQGYWLRFDATETKTRVPIDAPFPQALVPYLERYLSQYRPLLGQGGDRSKRAAIMALWISRKGNAISIGAFYGCIMKLTQAKFGHAINPHLFRDSAATSIATDDPEHVQVTHSVLGHSTLRTSERYYNHAKSLEATRRHQEQILELRRPGRDGHPDRLES
jgi:integrase/recombinase XerD